MRGREEIDLCPAVRSLTVTALFVALVGTVRERSVAMLRHAGSRLPDARLMEDRGDGFQTV
jgi:hypothetical protein